MGKEIKNIIFDLGGVLLNIDYTKTIRAFEKLGNKNFEALYSQASQNDLFNFFETGVINENDFIAEIKDFLPPNIKNNEVIDAWNAMLLDLPGIRVDALKNIRENYKIILLSNTNETHIRAFNNIILNQNKLANFGSLFDKTYFSHEIGMRKPNIDAFDFVMSNSSFKHEETVFFDDSIQHILGAQEAGIKAIHVGNGKTILDYFDADFKLKHLLL